MIVHKAVISMAISIIKFANSSNTREFLSFRLFQHSSSLRKSIGASIVETRESEQSYVQHTTGGPLVYRNLGQQLRLTAEQFPTQEAIVSCYENKRLTYADVLEKVDRMAAAFHQLGLEKGDRVGVWAPNGVACYLTIFAAARAGLISVGINPALQLPELEYALNKVEPKALVAVESFRSQNCIAMLRELLPELDGSSTGNLSSPRIKSLKSVIITSENSYGGTISLSNLIKLPNEQEISNIEAFQQTISPDSGACLLFTSGTTGQPKAALLSHFGLLNNGVQGSYRMGFDRKQHRICLTVPMFHVFGLALGAAASLNYGSTLVLPGVAFNAAETLQAIVREKCTTVYGTPTMYVDMLNELRKGLVSLPPLDVATIGASPCSPELLANIQNELAAKRVVIGYGMTETAGTIFISDREDGTDIAMGSVGRMNDHYEAKVVDRIGATVPFGMAGELCVRGFGTMLGFWGDEGKTKEVLDRDRWYRTGDQFVLRPDGYGNVVGRLKEVIIRGGENIYPREIEDVLNTHLDILESYCIGVPDKRLGEEVCAYVRVRDSVNNTAMSVDEVKKFCKGKIASFKIPRHLRVVDEFPKTASGKIQKFKLLAMFNKENK